MKRIRNAKRKGIIIGILCLALALSAAVIPSSDTYASDWQKLSFTKTAGGSAIGYPSNSGLQGLAFDTYSGKDGYCFTQSKDSSKVSVLHFTMDSKGWCLNKGEVVYSSNNLGHANDGTLYKDMDGNKWLFVALYGSVSEATEPPIKAGDGTKMELAAISLNDYNSGDKTVYACNIVDKPINGNITGVTYVGMQDVEGVERPVFVLMGGTLLTKAYLSFEENGPALTCFDYEARITKPVIVETGNPASTQGIAYHNGYIYLPAEGKTAAPNRIIVGRVKMSDLFDGYGGYNELETYIKDINKEGSEVLSKNAPESVFFTSLNKKSNIYMSVNRTTSVKENGKVVDKDVDAIIRSNIRF